MSKGFLVLAQNSDTDYLKQAYALAKSIKKTQTVHNNISLVTNDIVPEQYQNVFDNIIPIPFDDAAKSSEWKVENRWKLYYASPYDETIVLDSDMLFLEDMTSLWKYCSDKELHFTSKVVDHKNRQVVDVVYRKTFVENNLPNLYCGLFYFKKSDFCLEFFKTLEFVVYNWQKMFAEITPKNTQKFFSLDVATSITAKILNIEDLITSKNSPFKFVHMKPAIQGWEPTPGSWLSQTLINFNNDFELYINNFKQQGLFHYVEDDFLTDKILEILNG